LLIETSAARGSVGLREADHEAMIIIGKNTNVRGNAFKSIGDIRAVFIQDPVVLDHLGIKREDFVLS
jgi:hypothetical protein